MLLHPLIAWVNSVNSIINQFFQPNVRMRTVTAATIVVLLCLCAIIPYGSAQKTEPEYQLLFIDWMSKYGKVFMTAESYDTAFESFKKNFDMIERHNGQLEKSYDLECNQYCDWSWEKFKAYFNLDSTE